MFPSRSVVSSLRMYVYLIYCLFLQAEYLQPHLHGVVAFLNFMLIRLECFENSRLSRGKLVSNLLFSRFLGVAERNCYW